MKTSSNLVSYPVFPDWVFEGQLEIDSQIVNTVINDIKAAQKAGGVAETTFGWITNKNLILGPNIFKINKLVSTMFFDNLVSQYQLGAENRNIEMCDTWGLGIKPTYSLPVNLERHRWYQSVLFLQAEDNSSSLFFDQLGAKLYSTPVGVQPYTHYIKPKQNKLVFFPSHLPWGFTPNMSLSNTIVLCSSFIIKKI